MSKYNEESIQVLEGLEAVRKRPGMYIGSTDKRGVHHLVWEIIDNAVDEALNGHGDQIDIKINKDGSITIRDYGRGIPAGKHSSGKSTLEVIFTTLHAGGKFGGEESGYQTSGGLHGVGSAVTNALSKSLIVKSYFNGNEYVAEFKDGGKLVKPVKKGKKTKEQGTEVTFLPDDSIFTETDFDKSIIASRIQETAFLFAGLRLVLSDLRDDSEEEVYYYEEGLKAFLEHLNEGVEQIGTPIHFTDTKDRIKIEVAMQYNEGFDEEVHSYVNMVKTGGGGTHETGFKTALTRTINEFARKEGSLGARAKNFEGSLVREGLTVIISVSVPEDLLEFEGQTKDKLGTPVVRNAVDDVVSEHLLYYLEENRKDAKIIIDKIKEATSARAAARKASQAARKKSKKKTQNLLTGKLTPAQKNNPKKNELYIVEGDSAAGTVKQARDPDYQAVLPLRGKVLNTERVNQSAMLKNVELSTIIYTVGAGYGDGFESEDSNYDKIIITTDADEDGSHIQTLLLTFFYNYMRPLIEQGKVYIARPPRYRVSNGEDSIFCYSEEELDAAMKAMPNHTIQRYKGLGENSAEEIWETTMSPDTRTLYRVVIEDETISTRQVERLMGNKVEDRKNWIVDNINFDIER